MVRKEEELTDAQFEKLFDYEVHTRMNSGMFLKYPISVKEKRKLENYLSRVLTYVMEKEKISHICFETLFKRTVFINVKHMAGLMVEEEIVQENEILWTDNFFSKESKRPDKVDIDSLTPFLIKLVHPFDDKVVDLMTSSSMNDGDFAGLRQELEEYEEPRQFIYFLNIDGIPNYIPLNNIEVMEISNEYLVPKVIKKVR